MHMRVFIFRRLIPTGALVLLAAFLLACGSATNNDQGAAFTNLGFFSALPTDDPCASAVPAGLSGLSIPLSFAVTEDNSFSGQSAESTFGGGQRAVIGAQNNLNGQFLRVERVFFDFDIVGSSNDPPSTSSVLPLFLGPAISTTTTGGTGTGTASLDSSLPDSFADSDTNCNRNFSEVLVLPSDIRTWLNLNRASLPEAPFTIVVTAVLTGLTSAGDRFSSNDAQMFLEITPDNFIPPTDGSAGLGGGAIVAPTGADMAAS